MSESLFKVSPVVQHIWDRHVNDSAFESWFATLAHADAPDIATDMVLATHLHKTQVIEQEAGMSTVGWLASITELDLFWADVYTVLEQELIERGYYD